MPQALVGHHPYLKHRQVITSSAGRQSPQAPTDNHLKRRQVIVWYCREARQEGPIVPKGDRVCGSRDRRDGAAPEVVVGEDDLGLAVGHALHFIRPLTGKLYGSLAGLHAYRQGGNVILLSLLLNFVYKYWGHNEVEHGNAGDTLCFSTFTAGLSTLSKAGGVISRLSHCMTH